MTDKEKIKKLKRRFFRLASPKKDKPSQSWRVLFPGKGEVNPVHASLATRKQEAPIYCTGDQRDRKKVRDFLRTETCDLICRECYCRKFVGNHAANIAKLARKVSKKHCEFLHEGEFRFGVAQKYLNLKLKGLWVINEKMPPPPHCPFDAVILNDILGLGLHNGQTWTASNSRAEYNGWVKAAQKEADRLGYPNIAVWELVAYNHYKKHGLPIPHWKDVK